MATLGIKVAAWQAGTDDQREVMRSISEELRLGNPARGTIAGVEWFLSDDWRWKPGHIAYLGCLAANQSDVFAGWSPPKDGSGEIVYEQMRTELKAILEDPGLTNPLVKWQDIVVPEDTANVWQYILDQQSTPNFMQMWNGVPDGFVPTGDE